MIPFVQLILLGSSLADSPRGLNATLDALVQMEQKKPASNFSATAPMPSMPGMMGSAVNQQTSVAASEMRQQEDMFKQQQELLEQQQRQQQVSSPNI